MVLLAAGPCFGWQTTNSAASNQHQGQHQGQHQFQQATGGAGGAGGSAAGGSGGSVGNVSGGTATGGSVSVSGLGSSGGGVGNGPALYVPDGLGQAPCGGGIGLGAFGGVSGGSGGGTLWEFRDCKIMREAGLLRTIAHNTPGLPKHDVHRIDQAALNEVCQIGRVLEAFGGKCPTLYQGSTEVDIDADKNDYCFTRNAGDRNQHRECDRVVTRP